MGYSYKSDNYIRANMMIRFTKFLKCSVLVITIFMTMTGCKPKLSDEERNIISNNIPNELYNEKVSAAGYQLSEYLNDAVSEYAEELRNQLQNQIDRRNATNALLGGSMFDVNELFGTTTNELIARDYNRYIDYTNSHMNKMREMAIGMTEILGKHPEFIKKFNSEPQETISLEIFNELSNVPSSISGSSIDFGMLTLDDTDKIDWGEILMGDYSKPQLSVPAVLLSSILAIEYLEKPKATYAIYDDETDSWEVGYNSNQAINVTFKIKGDVVTYEYKSAQYNEAFLRSDLNVLKTK